MIRIGASFIAAALLAGAFPALGAPARQAEHRLTAAEIKELAQRELLWCDGFHPDTNDCQMITLMRLAKDGQVMQTTTWLDEAYLQVYVGDIDRFVGDRICSRLDAKNMAAVFAIDGKTVQGPAAALLKQNLAERFAQFDGKVVCQAFYRGSDPTRLREEVTVDGERRPDLESNYVLRPGSDGFTLRGEADDKGGKGIVV
jgi:hypothetical protein